MPLFFFHLRQSGRRLIDPDGVMLPNAAAARAEAIAAAQGFYQRTLGQLHFEWKDCALEMCDGGGRCVFLIGFAAAAGLPNAAHERTTEPSPATLTLGHTRTDFQYWAGRTRLLLERSARLADRSRYARKNLCSLRESVEQNRQLTREVMARSRQQSEEVRGQIYGVSR